MTAPRPRSPAPRELPPGRTFGYPAHVADDAQVTQALAALDRAEQAAVAIRGQLRRQAVRDQLRLGAAEYEHLDPIAFAAFLWLPAWSWMLFAAFAVVTLAPLPGVVPFALAGAFAALVFRTCLSIQAAGVLFTPERAELHALNSALSDSARAMDAIAADPYRGQPIEWAGDDPQRADRPWQSLPTIRRTARALRHRALPPAK